LGVSAAAAAGGLLRRREALREVVGQLAQAGDLVGGSRPGGVDVVAGPDEADGVDIGLQGAVDVAGGGGDVHEGGAGDPVAAWYRLGLGLYCRTRCEVITRSDAKGSDANRVRASRASSMLLSRPTRCARAR